MENSGFPSAGRSHSTAPPLSALHPKLFRHGEAGAGREEGAVPSGHAILDRELPGGGWPRAGLVEFCSDLTGIGELSLVLGVAPARPKPEGRGMVWILPPDSPRDLPWVPYAPGLVERGVALDQLVVLRCARHEEALWCAEQSARSGAAARILIWLGEPAGHSHSLSLRRLQQAASMGGATIFAFRSRSALRQPSPAVLRLALAAAPGGALEVELVKRRGLPDGKTVRLVPRSLACLQRPRTAPPVPAVPWLSRLVAGTQPAA